MNKSIKRSVGAVLSVVLISVSLWSSIEIAYADVNYSIGRTVEAEGGMDIICFPTNPVKQWTSEIQEMSRVGAENNLLYHAEYSTGYMKVTYMPNLTGKTRTWDIKVSCLAGITYNITFTQPSVSFDVTTGSTTTASLNPIRYSEQDKVVQCLKSMRDVYLAAEWTSEANGAALAIYAATYCWGAPYRYSSSSSSKSLDCTQMVRKSISNFTTSHDSVLKYTLSEINKNGTGNYSSAHYLWQNVTGLTKATVIGKEKGASIRTSFNKKYDVPGRIMFWYSPTHGHIKHTGIFLFNYMGSAYVIEASSGYDKNGVKASNAGATCVRKIQNSNSYCFYGSVNIMK